MTQEQKPKNFLDRFKYFGLGKERDYFLENLSALLASGMPIMDAIFAVRAEIQSKRLQKIIDAMGEDVQAGLSLADSLENTGMFSDHVGSLVRIGEKSGKLVENLKIIAVEQAKERSLKSKLRSATMYPGFVLSLTLIVGTGIAWFILPKLAIVFSQLKLKLPLITKVLIAVGLFLSKYGAYAIPAFFLTLGMLFYFLFSFRKTRFLGEKILFVIPGIKLLLKETEIARFGYLLGTLLSAGLSPTEALHSLGEATSLSRYRKFYVHLEASIADGNSFKKSFAQYKNINKLFPVPIQQLIIAGEQSGTLSVTLIKIGQDYEAKTDTTAKDFTIILEPILLVIVWLGVLGVAFAVILPIYSLIGGLNPNS